MWVGGSRTECQPPPPQSGKVNISVFKRERSSDERDFFVSVRESIVVVVEGSGGDSGIPRRACTAMSGNKRRTSCSSPKG